MTMLSDGLTYQEVRRDPAPSMERKLNAQLLQLKKKGSIPNGLYHKLRSSGGQTPLLYGLPKIHKPGVPLRPIVSFVSSPSYELSRYLSKILAPLIGNSDSFVRSSSQFVSFITSKTINPDERLVSFDVVSLFTKVPVELALDVANRRLSSDDTLPSCSNLSVQELLCLLEFCLKATYLCFRGRFFKQTYGTAMGSPVSVSIANLVMEDVEERALASYDIQLPFWKRYVDDVFTVVCVDRVQHLLEHLNSIECSIQFTVEVENDGELPFLDVNVYRGSDGSLNTSVHRKPTHTDRYLDFSSHHPFSHKRAVVCTLSSRVSTHSSSERDRINETSHVTSALRLNGYPQSFIQSSQSPHTVLPSSTPEYKACAIIPYVRGVSECIKRILTPLQIRVCYKPFQTFRQLLSRPKHRVPELQRSGVIYKIPCANCPMVYIGQTGRRLCQRLSEHKRAVRAADFNSSALAEHAWSASPVDWENTCVLSSCPDYHSRMIQEAIHIRSTNHTLNRDTGNLPPVYDDLVDCTC